MVKLNIKKVDAVIQARYGSSRLPGKILYKINNKSLLDILILRLKKSKYINRIIVASTEEKQSQKINNICIKHKVLFYKGSENNVLKRYYECAKKFKIKNILRITSDCPLIDPKIIDLVSENYFLNKSNYATNTYPPTYADGMDVEVFNFNTLKLAYTKSKSNYDKEHVTTYIRRIKNIKKTNIKDLNDNSKLRLTVDYYEDYLTIKKIIEYSKFDYYISYKKILNHIKKNKKLIEENKNFIRNDGMVINKGQKIWARAKNLIPGGTSLFSKNPDLYLPKRWPAYFTKTNKIFIWDIENTKYLDLCMMGIGTNVLGYSNKEVDKEVKKVIDKGNLSTFNCVEEVLLAEKLIEIHPWSNKVKFTRSGGEANAVAIRIARASTKKDNIAICGYHGWHDWYLSTNLSDNKNLNTHLMKNLEVSGVPNVLKNTCYAFEYNNIKSLEKLISKKDIGTIKMEVSRFDPPKNNFLKKVRGLANKYNIILIFDECSSGFRQTFGGLHKYYNVNPDIAVFGKTLGNGYAINAIIGKDKIMKSIENTFISSTFWTERVGPTAALKVIDIMEKNKTWKIIKKKGLFVKSNWKKLAIKNNLKIIIGGIDAIPIFYFNSKNNNLYKTFITQEMFKHKILATTVIYLSTEHKTKYLKIYFNLLNKIFKKISLCEKNKLNIKELLEVPASISGIREKV
jgi:glutamate-1-semialdehyde aminotransferase/spore coat polysaccharide biosynthesis protein SpsF (cytidylyltransferase family)